MENKKIILSDEKMARGAKWAGFLLGYKDEDGYPFLGTADGVAHLDPVTEAVFLKVMPEEIIRDGWNETRIKKYEIVAKRIGPNQWEVDYDIVINEML